MPQLVGPRQRLSAMHLNRLQLTLDRRNQYADITIRQRPRRAGSTVAKPFQFVSIVNGLATFRTGRVIQGATVTLLDDLTLLVAGGTLGSPVYVALRYAPAELALDLVLSASYPTHTASHYFKALASFAMLGSPPSPTLVAQHYDGDWDLTQAIPG
jgi:hypothetical protein